MAKVCLIFEDNDDAQMISFYSDRNISLDEDIETLMPAEQLASIAIKLLEQYVNEEGATTTFEKPIDIRYN
jgi:hypothetical protein